MRVHCPNGKSTPVKHHIIKRDLSKDLILGTSSPPVLGYLLLDVPLGDSLLLHEDEWGSREISHATADDDIHLMPCFVFVPTLSHLPNR